MYIPLSRRKSTGYIPFLVRVGNNVYLKNSILFSCHRQSVIIYPKDKFRRQMVHVLRRQFPTVAWDSQDLYPTKCLDTPAYAEYLDKCQVDIYTDIHNLIVLSKRRMSLYGNVLPLRQPDCLQALVLCRVVSFGGTNPKPRREPRIVGCELCTRLTMKNCVHLLMECDTALISKRNRITLIRIIRLCAQLSVPYEPLDPIISGLD
jgi:hypothetical protein